MSDCQTASHDLCIRQGGTWSRQLRWRTGSPLAAVNLTGFTARMQARPSYTSPTVAVELTTANGRIALGGALGTITLSLSASETAALTPGRYVFDLELVSSGGLVTPLVEGILTVQPEVTR